MGVGETEMSAIPSVPLDVSISPRRGTLSLWMADERRHRQGGVAKVGRG